jgi:hypothetical protein
MPHTHRRRPAKKALVASKRFSAEDLELLHDTPPWDWPRDAAKVFQEILSDKQAGERSRILAADLAGDFTVMNDSMADTLMSILKSGDEPAELRATVAISFGAALEAADIHGVDDPEMSRISEAHFEQIKILLHSLFDDERNPKLFRRRCLEASVRASANWHQDAIAKVHASGDKEWLLTAVFCMKYVQGFDNQILEALKNTDPEIQYEAVKAAGIWEMAAAWPSVFALVQDPKTPKDLLIAAIHSVAEIRPGDASENLHHLTSSEDVEIAEEAEDAILEAMAGDDFVDEDDLDEGDEWIN